MTSIMPIILIPLFRMSSCIQHLANKLVCGKYFIVQYFVKSIIVRGRFNGYHLKVLDFRLLIFSIPTQLHF